MKLCSFLKTLIVYRILENGGWDRLDEWLRDAIRSQNSDVIKRILDVALVMPTSSSKLTECKLTLTVQRLINTLSGKVPETILESLGEEEQQVILRLCLEVVVRWLKLKKRNYEEEEDLNKMILTDATTGEKVAIVALEHRIGYGLMAKNGQIFYVDLHQIPMQNNQVKPKIVPSIKPVSPAPVKNVSLSKPRKTPNLKHGPARVSNPMAVPATKSAPASASKLETAPVSKRGPVSTTNLSPNPVISPDRVSVSASSPAAVTKLDLGPRTSPSLSKLLLDVIIKEPDKQQFNEEPDLEELHSRVSSKLLENIEVELGKPRRSVHWWGRDGVSHVHEYEDPDFFTERSGCAKEKWLSIDCVVEEDGESTNNIPWRLRRIRLPHANAPLVDSDEAKHQLFREMFAPMWNPAGLESPPDTPSEPDAEGEKVWVKRLCTDPKIIPTEDAAGDADVGKYAKL